MSANVEHPDEAATIKPLERMPHHPVLDGWRGLSILAVILAHMLPLGPKRWDLNETAGLIGMSMFFTLSGFLITSTLIFYPSVRTFAVRRLCRIVPAVWLFILCVFLVLRAPPSVWRANLFFYANLPPMHLPYGVSSHLWSVCVEVQFYAFIGVLFLFLRKRGLFLLPVCCVAVTLLRVWTHTPYSIVTIYRVDEILAGCCVALFYHSALIAQLRPKLMRISPAIPLALLCLASYPAFTAMDYLRPYCAACMIGLTLYHRGTVWNRILECRPLKYLAAISYALYIWHPVFSHGWFASGSKFLIYAKRPFGILGACLVAHLSTFYFEADFIEFGKRLVRRNPAPTRPAARVPAAAEILKGGRAGA